MYYKLKYYTIFRNYGELDTLSIKNVHLILIGLLIILVRFF